LWIWSLLSLSSITSQLPASANFHTGNKSHSFQMTSHIANWWECPLRDCTCTLRMTWQELLRGFPVTLYRGCPFVLFFRGLFKANSHTIGMCMSGTCMKVRVVAGKIRNVNAHSFTDHLLWRLFHYRLICILETIFVKIRVVAGKSRTFWADHDGRQTAHTPRINRRTSRTEYCTILRPLQINTLQKGPWRHRLATVSVQSCMSELTFDDAVNS
jgi:hypothetical protein